MCGEFRLPQQRHAKPEKAESTSLGPTPPAELPNNSEASPGEPAATRNRRPTGTTTRRRATHTPKVPDTPSLFSFKAVTGTALVHPGAFT
jgi:hypothetical protein